MTYNVFSGTLNLTQPQPVTSAMLTQSSHISSALTVSVQTCYLKLLLSSIRRRMSVLSTDLHQCQTEGHEY